MIGTGSTRVAAQRLDPLHRDPVVVAGLITFIVVFFALTSVAVSRYHQKQSELGRQWFLAGEAALAENRAGEAVQDFRNALAYSRNNDAYRLRLAQALIAAGQAHEARAHLLSLWEQRPGDGLVNLELARLAARDNQISEAQRYYHGAIYGVWADDPVSHRIQVRFELCEFLFANHLTSRAEAELLLLKGVLPPKPAELHQRLGALFVRAGNNQAALDEYRQALATEPHSYAVLVAAGEAAFNLHEYAESRKYLEEAVAQRPDDSHSRQLLNLSHMAVELDPFLPDLPASARAQRALEDFKIGLHRLEQCAGQASEADSLAVALDQGEKIQHSLRGRDLERHPDWLQSTMGWVFNAERLADSRCAAPSLQDQALVLLGAKHAQEAQ